MLCVSVVGIPDNPYNKAQVGILRNWIGVLGLDLRGYLISLEHVWGI